MELVVEIVGLVCLALAGIVALVWLASEWLSSEPSGAYYERSPSSRSNETDTVMLCLAATVASSAAI